MSFSEAICNKTGYLFVRVIKLCIYCRYCSVYATSTWLDSEVDEKVMIMSSTPGRSLTQAS